jgi:hypothetical protein
MNNYPKILHNYKCIVCDYNTSYIKDYNKHLLTNKHINRTCSKNIEHNNQQEILQNNKNFKCNNCNKCYTARNSLWYHQKKCNVNNVVIKNNNDIDNSADMNLTNKIITPLMYNELTNIVLDIVKSNQELQKQNIELQKQMIDVCKNSQTINNTINNCNNKTFNLQVFLNETCKNAMNLSEFIENMSVELPDLENMGKLGYVEGVSNIIIKNLKALEITQRPIHCSDEKRETIMIKENNVWFKEGDDRENLRKIVSTVISRNLVLLAEYQEKYPDCNTYDSHRSDEYTKIIMETATNQVEKKKEKIFRIIAREVVIDKSNI